MVDIGANYGMYAYHLSRAVGSRGRVYAFEPVEYTFSCLRSVLKHLGTENVVPVNKGCGNREETVTFHLPLQESGAISAGLAHLPRGEEAASEYGYRREECEVVRLDAFLPGLAPSFMKIDVEGAELLVLEGAAETVERGHPTVVCEINPWFLEEQGSSAAPLLEFFSRRDYQLYQER